LPSPDIAVERVATRVSRGGHFIPTEIVIRWSGLRNMLTDYLPLADTARIYDKCRRRAYIGRRPIARFGTGDPRRRAMAADPRGDRMTLTPREMGHAADRALLESALLAALGYDPSHGRLGRQLLNNYLQRLGYGRPIDERSPDPLRPYVTYPDEWVRAVAEAVTGRPDALIGEVIAALKRRQNADAAEVAASHR
jgi:hypothetical protein